jgi:hypothetical protein
VNRTRTHINDYSGGVYQQAVSGLSITDQASLGTVPRKDRGEADYIGMLVSPEMAQSWAPDYRERLQLTI